MRIAITGSSGLIGSAVSARLREDGHEVTRVVRSREAAGAADAVYWRPSAGEVDAEGLAGHDAVINLAGENIFGVWTPAKKRRIYHSRVDGTRLLAGALAGLPAPERPGTLLNGSAKGYYGDRPPDEPLTEDAAPGEDFMAEVVKDWEAAAEPARAAGMRVAFLRFGLVVDPDALLMEAMTTATRLGVGATLGDASRAFPWVTLDDIAGVVLFLLEHPEVDGPVNVAAPQKRTHGELVDAVARVLDRPRFLAVPEPLVRLAGGLGDEVLNGAWVVPEKLESAGYGWRDPELEPVLRRMLKP